MLKSKAIPTSNKSTSGVKKTLYPNYQNIENSLKIFSEIQPTKQTYKLERKYELSLHYYRF